MPATTNLHPTRADGSGALAGRDGRRLVLRRAAPDDAMPQVDLLLRRSPQARRARSLSTRHFSLADAWREAERIGRGHSGVVVRDDDQGPGLGTAVTGQVLALARADGVAHLRVDLPAEDRAARRLLDRLGLPCAARTAHGETEVIAGLTAPAGDPWRAPAGWAA